MPSWRLCEAHNFTATESWSKMRVICWIFHNEQKNCLQISDMLIFKNSQSFSVNLVIELTGAGSG
jgi:hypothetical protein